LEEKKCVYLEREGLRAQDSAVAAASFLGTAFVVPVDFVGSMFKKDGLAASLDRLVLADNKAEVA